MFGVLVCALEILESACWLLQAMDGSGELWMALDGFGRLVEGFLKPFGQLPPLLAAAAPESR